MKKSYSVTIPLIPGKESDFDFYIQSCKEMGAERVFLFAPLDNICRSPVDVKKSVGGEEILAKFPHQESCDTPSLELYRIWADIYEQRREEFRREGIEADFWIGETIGHGGLIASKTSPFSPIIGPEGEAAIGCSCPMDPDFLHYIEEVFSILAEKKPGTILLDDDFRLNFHMPAAPVGCFCHRHVAELNRRMGTNLTREELAATVLSRNGDPEVRRTWSRVTGDSLVHMARVIERAVHKISPETRIGLATAMTHWSSEGLDMAELLRAFAGDTRPLIRTYGSPYRNEDKLAHIGRIVEFSQAQRVWLKKHLPEAEILAEGDTYPHTGYCCPIAMVHSYEIGLYALDFPEVLRYPYPFSAPASHETGYVDKTIRERERYTQIRELFADSEEFGGVCPLWIPNNMPNIPIPEDMNRPDYAWPDEPVALYFLSKMGIPLSYEEENAPVFAAGAGIDSLSDEQIEQILDRGAILDGVAARVLQDRGFDIGLTVTGKTDGPAFERYSDPINGAHKDETIWLLTGSKDIYYQTEVAAGGRIISSFTGKEAGWSTPAVVLTENAKGQRMMIYTFDLFRGFKGRQLLHNYARQEQLIHGVRWVVGRPLPVAAKGHPDLHLICRKKGKDLFIAMHNSHLDPLEEVCLLFDREILAGKELFLADRKGAVLRPARLTVTEDGELSEGLLEVDLPAMELCVLILKG